MINKYKGLNPSDNCMKKYTRKQGRRLTTDEESLASSCGALFSELTSATLFSGGRSPPVNIRVKIT